MAVGDLRRPYAVPMLKINNLLNISGRHYQHIDVTPVLFWSRLCTGAGIIQLVQKISAGCCHMHASPSSCYLLKFSTHAISGLLDFYGG
jgi:hypothetical protein